MQTIAIGLENIYLVSCYEPDGSLVWQEEIRNRVPTAGLNDILNKYINGVAYTGVWYVGLINNASFSALAAGDTAAKITATSVTGSTNGWLETVAYSETTRPLLVTTAAASGSMNNSASLATFTMSGALTLKGAFLVSSSVKAGTSGVLYGEGAFASTHAVTNGQVVTVQVTLTAATA